eukprot:TRINITY_DN1846_c0_g1_i2.p1 TRINITY_DN1846_c0_g1~~TRINITY_DN1846_c0_g1_i2.p1  ORF type:complete len:517 (-),score=134.60 TRINITY_DN1846_c0_g1_i2:971-2521(-)
MRKEDLNEAAELFELSSDGQDETFWKSRFQDHVAKCLRKHSNHILEDMDSHFLRLDVLKTKSEILEVVGDRLEGRVSRFDRDLANSLHMLRVAKEKIFEELLAVKASMSGGAADRPKRGSFGHRLNFGSAAGSPLVARVRTPGSAASPRVARLGMAAESPGAGESRNMGSTYSFMHPWEDAATPAASPTMTTLPRGELRTPTKSSAPSAERSSTSHRPAKILSLKQLRSIMAALFASKSQQDRRCALQHEPQETLEQHLYSFLAKRYGLKSVVQEWAEAIFRTIRKYAPYEVDVLAFGKILQNVLTEGFLCAQETLQNNVQSLLRSGHAELHGHRPSSEVDALWTTRTKDGLSVSECAEVVRSIYRDQATELVLERLDAAAGGAETIRYREFIKLLLKVQMSVMEHFLRDFVSLFREVDDDGDGIINDAQLHAFITRFGTVGDADLDVDIAHDDPNGVRLQDCTTAALGASHGEYARGITFSQCADLCTEVIRARWKVRGEDPVLLALQVKDATAE